MFVKDIVCFWYWCGSWLGRFCVCCCVVGVVVFMIVVVKELLMFVNEICLLVLLFIFEFVIEKVCLVEDGWNSCNLECVVFVYMLDS